VLPGGKSAELDPNPNLYILYTIKENAGALIVASNEIGIEVSSDKTKYMVMSPDQNAGRSHNIMTDNSSIESVEQFRY
jgi:hypothetical protein